MGFGKEEKGTRNIFTLEIRVWMGIKQSHSPRRAVQPEVLAEGTEMHSRSWACLPESSSFAEAHHRSTRYPNPPYRRGNRTQ
jgi:hypothetical protein